MARAQAAPTKKGLPPLAWVAIGCGGLIVVIALVLAVGSFFAARKLGDVAADFKENPAKTLAELAVERNPDLELVESNAEAGTITVRDTRKGETITVSYEDFKEGRVKFEKTTAGGETTTTTIDDDADRVVTMRSEHGEVTVGGTGTSGLPEWVVMYPGSSEPQIAYQTSNAEASMGNFVVTSSDDLGAVLDFYEQTLTDAGFAVQRHTMGAGAEAAGMVIATDEAGKRQQTVNVARDGDTTAITIQYATQAQ